VSDCLLPFFVFLIIRDYGEIHGTHQWIVPFVICQLLYKRFIGSVIFAADSYTEIMIMVCTCFLILYSSAVNTNITNKVVYLCFTDYMITTIQTYYGTEARCKPIGVFPFMPVMNRMSYFSTFTDGARTALCVEA